MYGLVRPLLFALDAERSHDLGLAGLSALARLGLAGSSKGLPALPTRALGLDFPNPVGLAAGLDKNGAYLDALAGLGFGFIEIGTVTPRPQPGNPKPRMFRLPEHQAVINRLGFNNDGVDALVGHVGRARYRGVLGINIGRNKDTPNESAVDDYLTCLERVYPLASYITVNISSPNTQGLRDLQQEATLRRFIGILRERQEQLAGQHGRRVPMLVKLAPDLDLAALDGLAATMLAAAVDGLVLTNTTIDRSAVAGHRHAGQAGGLSGRPLMRPATALLQAMHDRVGPDIPLVGVGGILSGADAVAKLDAGACLVQCYTGLVYRGPALVRECLAAIAGSRHAGALAAATA
jgi:dihydroorotate dehydrogenase